MAFQVASHLAESAEDTAPGLARRSFLDVNDFARHTGWLHQPAELYAADGVVLFALLLIVGWWLARRSGSTRLMAAALWTPIGMLLAVAAAQPISASVAEPRPFAQLHGILVLAAHSPDPGFPSDHATMAAAVAAGAWLVNRWLGALATLAALLLGFARVYVGVHYPQDVLGGFVLGAAVVLLGWALLARPLTALVDRAAGTPLRPLLTAGPQRPTAA